MNSKCYQINISDISTGTKALKFSHIIIWCNILVVIGKRKRL